MDVKWILHLPDSWSNWNLEMLDFEERGQTGVPGEKPLGERERTTTNSTHIRHQDLNLGNTGGRRALSRLHHPSSSLITECWRQFRAFTLSLYPISPKSGQLKPPSSQFFSRLPALNENPGLRNIPYLEALRFGNPVDSSWGSVVLDPLKSQRNDLANGKIPAEGSALGR